MYSFFFGCVDQCIVTVKKNHVEQNNHSKQCCPHHHADTAVKCSFSVGRHWHTSRTADRRRGNVRTCCAGTPPHTKRIWQNKHGGDAARGSSSRRCPRTAAAFFSSSSCFYIREATSCGEAACVCSLKNQFSSFSFVHTLKPASDTQTRPEWRNREQIWMCPLVDGFNKANKLRPLHIIT